MTRQRFPVGVASLAGVHPKPRAFGAACVLAAVVVTLCVQPAGALHEGGPGEEWSRFEDRDAVNLGPIGARGMVDGSTFVVHHVFPDSPADGKLQKGDVIYGANGREFRGDPRIALAQMIEYSESSRRAEGRLVLHLARDRKRETAEFRLEPIGAFSATYPIRCEKSEHIRRRLCAFIAEGQNTDGSWPAGYGAQIEATAMCGLALLASGEEQYADAIKRCADWLITRVSVAPVPGAGAAPSLDNWHYAYAGIFLAEYFFAMRDERAKEKLAELHDAIVRNQLGRDHERSPKTAGPPIGAWGHGGMHPDHGGGYTVVNAPGVMCLLAIALAHEAGVEIDREALVRGQDWIEACGPGGGVGYNHVPTGAPTRSGGAAVAYYVLGNRNAYRDRLGAWLATNYRATPDGHAEVQMSWLWSTLGLAVTHRAGFRRHMDHFRWHFNLYRMHDGSFAPQQKIDGSGDWALGRYWISGVYGVIFSIQNGRLRITGGDPSRPPTDAK